MLVDLSLYVNSEKIVTIKKRGERAGHPTSPHKKIMNHKHQNAHCSVVVRAFALSRRRHIGTFY